jgi:hypothetical protein
MAWHMASGDTGRIYAGGPLAGGGDNINITVSVTSTWDGSGVDAANTGLGTLGRTTIETAGAQDRLRSTGDDTSEAIRQEIAPIRSVSWDMLLMGRSLSILNNTFFGHNQILKDITGVIYGVGAAMRVFVTIADIERVLLDRGIIQHGILIPLLMGKAAAYRTVASAATQAAAAEGAAATMGATGALGTYASSFAMAAPMLLGFLQKGGSIPQTGPYMLHKGETVIPAGASMNIININMNSGPISSGVDVDRMLDSMALRMAQESRRRIGR